jgi:hypothetical protein
VELPSTGKIVCNFLMPDDYDGVLFADILEILKQAKTSASRLAFDDDMQYMYDIVVKNQQYINRAEYKLGNYFLYTNNHNIGSDKFISEICQDNGLTPYFGTYYFSASNNENNVKRLANIYEALMEKNKEKRLP